MLEHGVAEEIPKIRLKKCRRKFSISYKSINRIERCDCESLTANSNRESRESAILISSKYINTN